MALRGDTVDEADENINIRISGASPAGIDIGDNDIDIVLADNDPLGTTNPFAMPLVQFPNAQLSEPDAGCMPYLVSLHLARPRPTRDRSPCATTRSPMAARPRASTT